MCSRCSTPGCLCWADEQNVHCCLCGVDEQNVQCVQDAQHTAVFVERMNRMFTAVFVEWMNRMFNVFKMLNTLLSLWSGWTECSLLSLWSGWTECSLLSLWSGWTECSMCSRCSTHGCLCWADGQNVQCVQDAQHPAVFVGRMNRMFTAVFVGRMDRMFTAVFVEWMDRMFNVFNSQTLTSCAPMHQGLSDSYQHVPFLVDCNEWLLKVASLGIVQWLSTMFVHFWKQAPNLAHW